MAGGDLEVENADEARIDIEAVLKEYLRLERMVGEEAKNRLEERGLPYAQLGKMRSQVAKDKNLPNSDDIVPYLMDQILSLLFHSQNIAEVFAEDVELRKKITPILRKHMDVESELDKEVRDRIKNLSEGTAAFDVEYSKVMDQMKRKKGLE